MEHMAYHKRIVYKHMAYHNFNTLLEEHVKQMSDFLWSIWQVRSHVNENEKNS